MSEYVFNSSSNDRYNGGQHAATGLIITFLETLAELDVRLGEPALALKLPSAPWDLHVTYDNEGRPVSLGQLVNNLYENAQTRDLATFFDALQCYAPAVEMLEEAAIEAILRLSPSAAAEGFESVYRATCAAGYDAMQCVIVGGVLISLSLEQWQFDQGAFTNDGQVAYFDHASHPAHVDAIVTRRRSAMRDGINQRNFEAVRVQAFPDLNWGPDVARQMTTFPSEYLGLAFSRLANLDDIVRRWRSSDGGVLDTGSLILRNESKLTMDNYGDQRRFRSAAGTMKTYEKHVWIDQGNRIHLIVDDNAKTFEIGYLGPHLDTWKYS